MNQVDAPDLKVFTTGKHMTIIRVNLTEAVLFRTGQVKGIRCTQKHSIRQLADILARQTNELRSDREPFPNAIAFVLLKVFQDFLRFL